MPSNTKIPTPPKSLEEFARHIPDPETIRARIQENRREVTFLRRLLKLACEAEEASTKPKDSRK